jgi:hypothetical protein
MAAGGSSSSSARAGSTGGGATLSPASLSRLAERARMDGERGRGAGAAVVSISRHRATSVRVIASGGLSSTSFTGSGVA